MPNLFAMSFEGTLAPSFDLLCLHAGRKVPDGWGLAYYPGGEPSACVLKEPAPAGGSIRSGLIKAWDNLASSIFVVHIRSATWGQNSDANTQPFSRPHGGRDWLFGHAGSLRDRLDVEGPFQPIGSTDTERVFCDLLGRIAGAGASSLGQVDLAKLRAEIADLNGHGSLSFVMSDGLDLLVYADANGDGELHIASLLPPHGAHLAFGDEDMSVDLMSRGEISRKGVLVASNPLELLPAATEGAATRPPIAWSRIAKGSLLVVRQGAIVSEITATPDDAATSRRTVRPVQHIPAHAEPRRFDVVHKTTYRYQQPVERSTHLLRLVPVHDRLQSLLSHALVIQHDGVPLEAKQIEYEDVFGNRARRLMIEQPFRELSLEARSTVEVLDSDALRFRPLQARRAIPLVWMPWQREMMAPYLLPEELPETQLQELADYAMTFVERNDYDLIGTLLDMNSSIYKEYEYKQGSTTNATTAFDVYANRRGVCQDFTNLLLCLARLLGVPARYVCGYVYTGPKAENQVQSEASHAWAQLYLPEVGWKGFDPTNGILTQTEHIRVSVGRGSIDATPTSGTLYVGGGVEALTVEVRVEPSAPGA